MVAPRETVDSYRTNLTPNDFPRRQITSQVRPVLASREKASRTLPASTLESATVIFAPAEDISCTKHRRAAKPPSSVTQAGCCTDLRASLRASRFLLAAVISCVRGKLFSGLAYPIGALKTVAISA